VAHIGTAGGKILVMSDDMAAGGRGSATKGVPLRQARVSGVLGVIMVIAVVLTLVGLAIVQRVSTSYRDALLVAEDSAAVAAAAADPATGLAADLADLTRSLGETLDQVRELAETAATATGDLAAAMRTNLAESVEGTAQVADRVADVVEGVERFIPGNSRSLAEELRTLADGLAPVPGQLRDLGDELDAGSRSLTLSLSTLNALGQRIDIIADGIDETTRVLGDLPAVARTLEASAQRAGDRVSFDLWLFRLAVVLAGGALFLVALVLRRMQPVMVPAPQ
jgi:ABC-type transporter Mla subunit MlaD